MVGSKRGFTLIEVLMSVIIIGLILPPIGMAFINFLTVPPEQTDRLWVSHEVRQIADWITQDGRMAETFLPPPTPNPDFLYGTFRWTDYTDDIDHEYDVAYRYDDGKVIREETVTWFEDDEWQSDSFSVVIAQNVANYGDLSFEVHLTNLEVNIKSSRDPISAELTIRIVPRVFFAEAGPSGWPWGPDAIHVGDSGACEILLSGRDNIIAGDLHSDSVITVTARYNVVTGEVECQELIEDESLTYGSLKLPPDAEILGMLDLGEPGEFEPRILEPSGTYPDVFVWDSDVDLDDEDEVWESDVVLKPGIYYSTGEIALPRPYVSGEVTFIADNIVISGRMVQLSPYSSDLLLWGTGSGEEVIHIQDSYWWIFRLPFQGILQGSFYVPDGEIELEGGGSSIFSRAWLTGCAMVAQKVTISGTNWYISRW